MLGLFRRLLLAAALLGPALPSVAQQAPTPPDPTTVPPQDHAAERALIRKLFAQGPDPADFSESFLSQVDLAAQAPVFRQIADQLGPVQRIEAQPEGRYQVTGTGARLDLRLLLDAAGQIALLSLRAPVPLSGSLEQAQAALAALPGDSSWIVTRGGQVLAAQDPDRPLAVGSAFKLGVLTAVKRRIQAGDFGWDTVVLLLPQHRSLPTGILQDWPVGSALTVESAAALMISLSDNTATDLLFSAVGRPAVADALDLPLPLTTREYFTLKADPDLARRYAEADEPARRALLGPLGGAPLPDVSQVMGPALPAVAWRLPVSRLCTLIADLGGLALMSISPGPAADLAPVLAYKGGSDAGVVNFTTLLDSGGAPTCVSLTVNGPGADLAGAAAAYRGLIAALPDG